MKSPIKKILITGITGFAGSYLAEHLVSKNEHKVFGTYLQEQSLVNVEKIKDKLQLVKIDLSNKKNVFNLIKDISPTSIFHLAALTSPADSFRNPTKTLTNNISLEINLLEAVRKYNMLGTRILIISSADIYGLVGKKDLPINEDAPLMPTNPYSVSKIAQDFLGLSYFLSYQLKIVRVRPFNHIGPRQSSHFVVSSLARQIAEIEKGIKGPILKVGNLESKRDFTDVKDMVRAYALVLDKGREGEVYNIGSNRSYRISDILNKLISMSSSKITVKKDANLFRPNDNPELLCDASKFMSLTNWKPEVPIDTTLRNTLDYWRNII